MDVRLTHNRWVNAKALQAFTNKRNGNLRGFLHHVAKLTRQNQLTLTAQEHAFNRQNFATDTCPGKACYNTRAARFRQLVVQESRSTEVILKHLRRHFRLDLLAHHNVFCTMAHRTFKHAFKFTHARFACPAAHHGVNHLVAEAHLFAKLHARAFTDAREQILARNLQLFMRIVARQAHHFHTVTQSFWNFAFTVCRRNKEHTGEVETHFHEVVSKVMVLFRIQNFEHSACRVTSKVACHLVDFIEQNHRVHALCTA